MKKVLIDTSAWIDFLRSKSGSLGDAVVRAIEQERAVLCGVVVAELLQGAKGKKEQKKLEFLVSHIERVQIAEDDWDEAGKLLQGLRNKGVSVPLSDAVIAVVARRLELSILTLDKHFKQLPVLLEEIVH